MPERILEIKKTRGCALIQTENDSLRVPLSLLRERPVHTGEMLDLQAYRLFIAERGYTHALDHAVRLLSLCDRSENEVRHRLMDVGYPGDCVDRVIEKLYEAELLDDAAYAQRWAQSRAHKHGRNRIERELTHRGISRELAQDAVSELSDEEQLADAVRLTGKFLARTQGDFDRSLYNRTLAMLARHGYDADIARRALQVIAEGRDEENQD
jgi:regulatory protein